MAESEDGGGHFPGISPETKSTHCIVVASNFEAKSLWLEEEREDLEVK